MSVAVRLGSHSFTDKKSRTFQDPMRNFPGPFRSPRMSKYEENDIDLQYSEPVVHCTKFSMKQNVDVSCSEFRWTHLHIIYIQWSKYIFPELSRTLSFDVQDFPEPKWFSRTFQVLAFSIKKNPGLSGRRGNPDTESDDSKLDEFLERL